LRENISQTFLLLSGPASVGKSVLINIIEKILGESNVDELHPDRLNNPFEMVAYSSKSLLTAKDVENDVLSANKINAIKKMTGNDLLSCEQKHSNYRIQTRGCFNIIITGNGDLTLNYGSSRDAFQRRMLWIDCVTPDDFKRINNFDDVLIQEEREGILAWAIEGAKKLLTNNGKIIKSEEQNKAIEYLLDESAPIDSFVKNCVSVVTDCYVTSTQVVEMFYRFARYCKWNNDTLLKLTQRQIEQKFYQAILRWKPEIKHSTNIRHTESGKSCRGYLHCRISLPE
jgi:phage/plasmid-associated DNA primase